MNLYLGHTTFSMIVIACLAGELIGISPILAQQSNQPLNASSFGAACDGSTDDTASLNQAIAAATQGNSLLFLPQGTCRITGPLTIATSPGHFPQLRGYGASTQLLADYSSWRSTVHAAVSIKVTTANTFLEAESERIFGDLQITGENNANLPDTTGVSIQSGSGGVTSPGSEGSFAPYRLKVQNIQVQNFDTCYAISDFIESALSFAAGTRCRVGISAIGYIVNDTFHNLAFNFGSKVYTSNPGPIEGIVISGKEYACSGASCSGGQDYQFPQGLVISDSHVLNYGTDIDVQSAQYVTIHDSVLDVATAGPVINLINPIFINIHDNYLGAGVANQSGINITPSGVLHGLWISNNTFVGYGSGDTGIDFGPSTGPTWQGVQISGNIFTGFVTSIFVGQNIAAGAIINNTGYENHGSFIDISQAQQLGAISIDGNRTLDAELPVFTGSSPVSGYRIGQNQSASAVTSIRESVDINTLGNETAHGYYVGQPGDAATGFSGSCPSGHTLIVVGGIVTGCQ